MKRLLWVLTAAALPEAWVLLGLVLGIAVLSLLSSGCGMGPNTPLPVEVMCYTVRCYNSAEISVSQVKPIDKFSHRETVVTCSWNDGLALRFKAVDDNCFEGAW